MEKGFGESWLLSPSLRTAQNAETHPPKGLPEAVAGSAQCLS